MPITQLTPKESIEGYLMQELEKRDKALLYALAYIGEQVVNIAKNTRGYIDRTGNLVSSIGYVIVKDGKVVKNKFTQTLDGSKGVTEGQKYSTIKASEMIPSGVGIVVVAGMDYAKYVEATGRNVLTRSELEARALAKQMIKKLGMK